jgi:hypothetical protein
MDNPVIFSNQDEEYLEWVDPHNHPDGYVMIVDLRPNVASWISVHSAQCHTVNRERNDGKEWTKTYAKVCSDDLELLKRWAARTWPNRKVAPCGHCKP